LQQTARSWPHRGVPRSALGLVVSLLLAVGCGGGPVRVPQLGLGPFQPGDGSVFEETMRAAIATGHMPTQADPVHGRFVLLATSDPFRETRFVVQCYADGWVTVSPSGRRVEVTGTSFRVPHEVRAEYAQLVIGLERGVTVVDR
jgi:hypothetical protein